MRNIFEQNKNEINYSNYEDIIYNYDNIEEELGKKILPGLKMFNHDKIKFITYLYEGFRGEHSSVLVDYNNKYIQKDLDEREKESLNDFVGQNNSNRFYNDVFSSLQILMNQIIKGNYPQNHLLYQIIDSLPNYIILNNKLVEFFRSQYEYYSDEKIFTVNSLVSIFDYFEALCWKEMKKNIPLDYQQELSEETKNKINSYFDKNINEKKIINKENLTSALRKLISRSISGTRQEMEIKNDAILLYYICKEELWNKSVLDTDGFENEIDEIFSKDILVGQTLSLYELLDGDNILRNKLEKNKEKEKDEEREAEIEKQDKNNLNVINSNEEDLIINTDSNKFKEENEIKDGDDASTNIKDSKDDSEEEENEDEEDEDEDYRQDEI